MVSFSGTSIEHKYSTGIEMCLVALALIALNMILGEENIVSFIARSFFGSALKDKGPKLTFIRLCTSIHLRDLQQIASFTLIIGTVVVISGLYYPDDVFSKIIGVSAGASTAAAVLSYTYQVGSKRIGSVDLFANEISVICRVCLVVDFASASISQVFVNSHYHIMDLTNVNIITVYRNSSARSNTRLFTIKTCPICSL